MQMNREKTLTFTFIWAVANVLAFLYVFGPLLRPDKDADLEQYQPEDE